MTKRQRKAVKQYQSAHKLYQAEIDANVRHISPDIQKPLCAAEDALIDAMIGDGAADRAKRLGGYCAAIDLARRYANID